MNQHLKIAIAEASAIIRFGLDVLLKRLPGFHIQIVDISSGDMLIETLKAHHPDILIINPLLSEYAYKLAQMKEECDCLHMKCIALLTSVLPDDILKPFDEHITTYHEAGDIGIKFERIMEAERLEEANDDEAQNLSAREKEIVVCVVKGMTNREIADRLCISTHTVITHRRNIARKLQIHTPSGLTIYAIVNKLVELSEISAKGIED